MTEPTSPTLTKTPKNKGGKRKHPAVSALAAALPQDSTEAAALLHELTATMREALPAAAVSRLERLERSGGPEAHAERERDVEVARLRADGARERAHADRVTAKADALAALEPAEYAHKLAEAAARRAGVAAERERKAEMGTTTVHGVGDDFEDVEVSKYDLNQAGWHHRTECGTDAELGPDHVLILDTWTALRDAHDTMHGLTSWTGCPHEPCRSIPEDFQREPWHRVSVHP